MSSPKPRDSKNKHHDNPNFTVVIDPSPNTSTNNHEQTSVTSFQSHHNPDDEIPPPYSADIQIPTPTHSRDHTPILFSPPPNYVTKQPKAIHHPSHNNRLSDESTTNEELPDNDVLLSPDQPSKICKICQESEDESSSDDINEPYSKGKLISPCKCKGSLQYVHIGCLNRWRYSDVREEASYRCEVCKYEYKFYRPRIAKIFSSSFTLHILSLFLLLSIILILSYIVKLVDHNKKGDDNHDEIPHHPGGSNWRHIQILNIPLAYIIIGCFITSAFGFIFFILLICMNGFNDTRNDLCYCSGCDMLDCHCGACNSYNADCGDCGGMAILIIFIIIGVIFLIGLTGAVIAAYLSIQKIMSRFLVRVHDRILEVTKD